MNKEISLQKNLSKVKVLQMILIIFLLSPLYLKSKRRTGKFILEMEYEIKYSKIQDKIWW